MTNTDELQKNTTMQINDIPSSCILTADIGGSHITTGIYNINSRTVMEESVIRFDVVSKGAANDILASWGSAFKRVLGNTGISVAGLSVAMPGPFDYEKGVSYIKGLDKYESLYGMNIKEPLAAILKLAPQMIKFRNDAESTIAGEVLMGAGKTYNKVMGVTLGTGFGSAYSENKVTKDINLGSDPFKDSIADDYLSTRWFLKRHIELTGISLIGGVKELALLAEKSDIARDIFKEFAINMANFLKNPVLQLKPDVLILCGNIAKASKFFLPQLIEALHPVDIKLAQLGENAPLIGAAANFDNTINQPV
jgi:glucokinase